MVDDNRTNLEIMERLNRSEYGIQYAMRKYNLVRSTEIEDLENEIWKDIPGYEGYYQVSNYGRVKSLPRWIVYSDGRKYFYDGVLLKQKHDHGGYCGVELTTNSELETFKVHRLVAKMFIPNPDNLPEVNHKDENKDNNCVDNLEWCDNYYNNHYGTRLERMRKKIVEAVGRPVEFTKISTGEKFYFPTITSGVKELNLDPRTVQRCLKKEPRFKTTKGYTVEYA